MSVDTNKKSETPYCKTCNNFYASVAYDGLCSGCYKKNNNPKKEQVKIQNVHQEKAEGVENKSEKSEELVKSEKVQADKKKCFACMKKLGNLGNQCKCGFVYCNMHRLPEEHECIFNHKQAEEKKLKQKVFKVEHQKIQQI